MSEISDQSAAGAEGPRPRAGVVYKSLANFQEIQAALEAAKAQLKFVSTLNQRGRFILEIDPRRVHESRWAVVPPSDWASDEYLALRASIEAIGGNVQPIKVRPRLGSSAIECISKRSSAPLEIVFGHRRHRACLELGLPVLCIVEDRADAEAFAEMVAEYCWPLTKLTWRLAEILRRATDELLFPSTRRLAEGVSLNHSDVGLLLSMARLPESVRNRFDNAGLTQSMARRLTSAYSRDPIALQRNACGLDFSSCRRPRAVLDRMLQGLP
jgi:ParB family transcriptional regulator, chromosome partitioning protein